MYILYIYIERERDVVFVAIFVSLPLWVPLAPSFREGGGGESLSSCAWGIYIYIYIYVYIYIYTHIHTYTYISLSLYIYIYIYTQGLLHRMLLTRTYKGWPPEGAGTNGVFREVLQHIDGYLRHDCHAVFCTYGNLSSEADEHPDVSNIAKTSFAKTSRSCRSRT